MPRSIRVDVDSKVFKWLRSNSGGSVEDVSKRLKTSIDLVETIPIVGKEIYPLVYESYELGHEEIVVVGGLRNGN